MVWLDITPGVVSDRITNALSMLDYSDLQKLYKEGGLKSVPQAKVRANQLKMDAFDKYCEYTGLPLCYFFFGTQVPPIPMYTYWDKMVVTLLNAISAEKLEKLSTVCYDMFPVRELPEDLNTPDDRILHIINRERYGFRSTKTLLPFQIVTTDVDAEIERAYHHTTRFVTDCYADISTVCGISLHWIIGCNTAPLFCNTIEGERLFTRYTMLPKAHQEEFLWLLMMYVNGRPYFDAKGGTLGEIKNNWN